MAAHHVGIGGAGQSPSRPRLDRLRAGAARRDAEFAGLAGRTRQVDAALK